MRVRRGNPGSRLPWLARIGLLVAVLAGGVVARSLGQAAPKVARATRLTGPAPRIDGVMDEGAWAQGVPITDFVQAEPFVLDPRLF